MKERLLEGKAAVVTGSGQGIGREIALCLAGYGAKVITNNRKPGSSLNAFEGTDLQFNEKERAELLAISGDAETTAREILEKGGEAIPFYGDVSDEDQAQRMVQAAIDAWGRIDIIVNNASSNWTGRLEDMDTRLFNISIDSKLKGSFYLMHYAFPYMKEQGFGRILNSASDAFTGIRNYAAYGAANAGIVALTKAAAKEWQDYGITVNAYTPLARTRAWYNAAIAYKRRGVPEEMIEQNAPAAMRKTAEGMVPFLAYLASEEAGDLTGLLFHLASNGEIGLWSESEVIRMITDPEGIWTAEKLRLRLRQELIGTIKEEVKVL